MVHPLIQDVTNRIIARSAPARGTYLARIAAAKSEKPQRLSLIHISATPVFPAC